MLIKQLSVFLEDKTKRLTEVTRILAENDINITAFSITDAPDYGILRLIVGRPELALKLLKENGFSVNSTDVLGIVIPNRPGGLHNTLEIISNNGIAIDYMYAFAMGDTASAVVRTATLNSLIEVIQKNGMELVRQSQVYQD